MSAKARGSVGRLPALSASETPGQLRRVNTGPGSRAIYRRAGRGGSIRKHGSATPYTEGATRRKNHISTQKTATLVGKHALIVTEALTIDDVTASAEGTAEKPGKNIKQRPG
jgi:hypothetical protein